MTTIKEVAQETGLSVGTVSRVLNDRGYISEETCSKVYAAMEKLNYQPNELARSLSKQSSTTIGVIVPHIRNQYFAELVGFLEEAAYKKQHRIMLFLSNEKEEKEDEYLAECRKNRVAGIILCSGRLEANKFSMPGTPVVTIERDIEDGTACVECDNRQGGRLAAEHLIAQGCKSLVHLSGVLGTAMPADQRADGFIAACEAHNIQHWEMPTTVEEYEKLDYFGLFERMYAAHPNADGVFASSDTIAAQLLQFCAAHSISVPQKLKVVGFDDVPLAALTVPTITTIHQPIKEMAEIAIEAIVNANSNQMTLRRVCLPVSLIKRQST